MLGYTLASLAAQDRAPDRVVVIADNCTDGDRHGGASSGCRGVRDRRQHREEGGALNQVLDVLVAEDRTTS